MKFLRLFLRESQFQFRLAVLFIIGFIASFQFFSLRAKAERIVQLKAVNAALDQTQIVSRKRQPQAAVQRRPVITPRDLVLEGTSNLNGSLHALISGNIFKVGDALDDYSVVEITMDRAILRNQETQETRTLYLKG